MSLLIEINLTGSAFTGSKTSVKRKKSLKLSNKSEAVEGVLTSLIAASALSFSASIGPIDDINKQLLSKTKSKVGIEEKISKNSGFKQNGDAISKEAYCEEQFKSNNSLKTINEINFKTLSIEEEEKNDEELKGQDEDIMAVICSESKSLDYLARTAAINLGNPTHPTSKIDYENKSAAQISKTPKPTQSSKSLDDILFSEERIKSTCNVKVMYIYFLNQYDFLRRQTTLSLSNISDNFNFFSGGITLQGETSQRF